MRKQFNYLYFTGSDGCGKTTYLKLIEDYFIKEGKNVYKIWIRSPKILSKPLMLYCRIVGLTKYKNIDGVNYGSHNFHKSKMVSYLFPILQLIDFKIKSYLMFKKISNKVDYLLFDRYAIDTLADLMVDTRRYNLHKQFIGRMFIKMIPNKMKIVVLQVDEEIIRKRKKDTLHDVQLKRKIDVYKILAKDLNLITINNNKNIDDVKKSIFDRLEIYERI